MEATPDPAARPSRPPSDPPSERETTTEATDDQSVAGEEDPGSAVDQPVVRDRPKTAAP